MGFARVVDSAEQEPLSEPPGHRCGCGLDVEYARSLGACLGSLRRNYDRNEISVQSGSHVKSGVYVDLIDPVLHANPVAEYNHRALRNWN